MKRVHLTVTQSELSTLRTCAWKHHLRYELQLESTEPTPQPLRVGRIVHSVVESLYATQRKLEDEGMDVHRSIVVAVERMPMAIEMEMRALVREAHDEEETMAKLAEIEDEVRAALHLFSTEIFPRNVTRYRVEAVELAFEVPLLTPSGRASGDMLVGVFDLVLEDRVTGEIALGELKTTAEDANQLSYRVDVDPQLHLYAYALRRIYGRAHDGLMLLDVVRKKAPSEPKWNKDGSLSVAQIATTREMYLAAMAEAELKGKPPTDKHRERLATLGGIERFACQHEERLNFDAVNRHALDAWNGARLIRLFRRGELTPWRNGASCNSRMRGCEYREACVADVREADGILLRARPARHGEVEEAKEERDRTLEADVGF